LYFSAAAGPEVRTIAPTAANNSFFIVASLGVYRAPDRA
jgi:hypothetical protein